jgi:pimeloyl-ACP methyl ester carboxylesterase
VLNEHEMNQHEMAVVPSVPRLAYRWAGVAGRPVVVLLHSLGASGAAWEGVIEELGGAYSLLVPDLRGHGRSEPAGVADVAEWAADLERVLGHAGIRPKQRFALVGVSLGGIQAMAFAATRPERVSALVVADSFAALPPEVAAQRIATQIEQASLLPMPEVAERYVAATFADQGSRGAKIVRDVLAGMDPDSYAAAVRTCFGADVRPLLAEIATPTLVLCGDRDDKTPLALSRSIVAGIAGSRLAIVPDAGHLAPLDNPAAFGRLVASFLAADAVDSADA